jgi:hypothetical protein
LGAKIAFGDTEKMDCITRNFCEVPKIKKTSPNKFDEEIFKLGLKSSSGYGNRTRVSSVKGTRPNP